MTGGRVAVLGRTGRNFAAGMSGGIAYVLDEDGGVPRPLQPRARRVRGGRGRRASCARSSRSTPRARARRSPARLLADWPAAVARFVKVVPHDYKRALRARSSHDLDRQRLPDDRVRGGGLMGKLGGFLKYRRVEQPERDPRERVGDFREFMGTLPLPVLQEQGARCMECGVPFCHHGCPLGNLIPEWNDLVYRDRWREAIDQLHRTNNFPEFTGRLCPAPCEAACVLEINEGNAVTIKQIEVAIVNRAWDEGWIVPQPPARAAAGRVAVVGVGAGRARLRAAARARPATPSRSTSATRRAAGSCASACRTSRSRSGSSSGASQQLEAEGVEFRFGVEVGVDVGARGAARAARRGRARRRLARAARPARAGPRARRRALRDGVPVPAQPLGGARARAAGRGRAAGARERDHRRRQARDRHRRRRHRRRLRRRTRTARAPRR